MQLQIFISCIFLSIFCCFSCSNPSFQQVLAGADSMTLYFYPHNADQDTIITPLEDLEFMKEFVQCVSDERAVANCPKTGKIIFHKMRAKEDITSAEFSISPECEHITYHYRNKKYTRKLSENNLEFLRSIWVNWKIIHKLEKIL